MKNIVRLLDIVKSKLDSNNYINSLIKLLLEYNIITYYEVEEIMLKFLYLLRVKGEKYTASLTSSIDVYTLKIYIFLICILLDYI